MQLTTDNRTYILNDHWFFGKHDSSTYSIKHTVRAQEKRKYSSTFYANNVQKKT